MKKCPYCAEEIREDAIICRYCARRVRGRYKRLIFIVIIVAILVSFYLAHKGEADRLTRQFTEEAGLICRSFTEIIKELPSSLKAIKEYPEKVKEMSEMYHSGGTNIK